MVEFEGVSFEFDVTDADTFDAISDFEKNWKAALNKLKTAPSGDAIREVNGCIKDLLDRSCEGDVHGEIFKGRASLAKTTRLWSVISEEIKRQSAEMKQLISEVNGD